ncbi:MAG: spore coat protein [Paenibacillus sp.]|jgi:spore coat protein CotF|nr:spore coat protein [Paenibacillus sp.]
MNQQMPTNNMTQAQGAANFNHGGHEIFDVHEVLTCSINVLDQFMMCRQYVKDQELLSILDRQYNFMLSQYNLTVECFTTGQKPGQETGTYMITNMTQPIYGLKPTPPCKPNQSMADIKDSGLSSHMLGLIKSHASLLTMSSLEVTNPVVRRVLASQVQNFIEMAYEIFLYQNKHGYYQVPQLAAADMQSMLNSFAPAAGMPQMPAPNQTASTLH